MEKAYRLDTGEGGVRSICHIFNEYLLGVCMLKSMIILCMAVFSYDSPAQTESKENRVGTQISKREVLSFPLFESAYFNNHNIEFESKTDIDWKSQAPKKIKSIDIKNPTVKDLEYIKTGEQFFSYSSFYFDLPVSLEIGQEFYYLVSKVRIAEIRPLKLRGTARFELNELGSVIYDLIYYGKVIANVDEKNKVTEGGFVMTSNVPLGINSFLDSSSIQQLFSARVKNKKIVYTYKHEYKSLTLTLDEEHPVKIVTIYTFKVEGVDSDYIFVQWSNDEKCDFGCCSNSYSLFSADQELKEVKWTRYGCDV